MHATALELKAEPPDVPGTPPKCEISGNPSSIRFVNRSRSTTGGSHHESLQESESHEMGMQIPCGNPTWSSSRNSGSRCSPRHRGNSPTQVALSHEGEAASRTRKQPFAPPARALATLGTRAVGGLNEDVRVARADGECLRCRRHPPSASPRPPPASARHHDCQL